MIGVNYDMTEFKNVQKLLEEMIKTSDELPLRNQPET